MRMTSQRSLPCVRIAGDCNCFPPCKRKSISAIAGRECVSGVDPAYRVREQFLSMAGARGMSFECHFRECCYLGDWQEIIFIYSSSGTGARMLLYAATVVSSVLPTILAGIGALELCRTLAPFASPDQIPQRFVTFAISSRTLSGPWRRLTLEHKLRKGE